MTDWSDPTSDPIADYKAWVARSYAREFHREAIRDELGRGCTPERSGCPTTTESGGNL